MTILIIIGILMLMLFGTACFIGHIVTDKAVKLKMKNGKIYVNPT